MCGICGFVDKEFSGHPTRRSTIERMLGQQRHRGPDGTGIHEEPGLGIGHARLSIVGLEDGQQPIANEDESIWIAVNGEVFNHKPLRDKLVARGHRFRTHSDSEVVLHLYEDYGMDLLDQINGQFAFALWDSNRKTLILCRDRHGILPLFYTQTNECYVFASELKALMQFPGVEAKLDVEALDQTFTFWTPLSTRTALKNVFQVDPGCFLTIQGPRVRETRYWDARFPEPNEVPPMSEAEAVEQLRFLLRDAVDIRRQADVPVGCYLSGGLDSSAVTVIASRLMGHAPEAFSVQFAAAEYDEGEHQDLLTRHSGIDAAAIKFTAEDLIQQLAKAIYFSEQPVLRTGMVPMMLLSQLVRESNFKAVLAGEGADEFSIGYNIFKEMKVRRFWARQPQSTARPSLLSKLYPYLAAKGRDSPSWQSFFAHGLEDTSDAFYSHRRRWSGASRAKRFFSADLKQTLGEYSAIDELEASLPAEFQLWAPMGQAQYVESKLFLSNYLLSSQGDRMAMANSVEVRYPFLDHRLVEFCNTLPDRWKMRGLKEKRLLKQAVKDELPSEIVQRAKQPYRAPGLTYVDDEPLWEFLSPRSIEDSGLFDARLVGLLLSKLKQARLWSEADQMALTGILTTQLFHAQFLENTSNRTV